MSNSTFPEFTVVLFSFSSVRWQSTNKWVTWIPTSFSIELCSRVNHARWASTSLWDYSAPATGPIIGSQTAQNWCRVSATEIGRKTAKTARDAKMFDATECWEYVATVYRYILPGNLEWIAIHWQMLESAQNWSPNGSCNIMTDWNLDVRIVHVTPNILWKVSPNFNQKRKEKHWIELNITCTCL